MSTRTPWYDPLAPDYLYRLLPKIFRRRDAGADGALGALMHALGDELARQHLRTEQDMRDQFIETCAPDSVARLAALVGVEGQGARTRERVALAIALTRIKGTALALEKAIEAATGWTASVTEQAGQVIVKQWRQRVIQARGIEAMLFQDGVWHVDPLGYKVSIYHRPQTLPITQARDEADAPTILTGVSPSLRLHVVTPDGVRLLSADEIDISNKTHQPAAATLAVINPRIGQIKLAASLGATALLVDRGMDVPLAGASPCRRVVQRAPGRGRWRVRGGGEALRAALAAWADGFEDGELRVEDGRRYGPLLPIELGGRELSVAASMGQVPTLVAPLVVRSSAPARLILDGLVLAGGLEVHGPVDVVLSACTAVASGGAAIVHHGGSARAVDITVDDCDLYGLQVKGQEARLTVRRSLLRSGQSKSALEASSPRATEVALEHTTIDGEVDVARLVSARGCIFASDNLKVADYAERALYRCAVGTAAGVPERHLDECEAFDDNAVLFEPDLPDTRKDLRLLPGAGEALHFGGLNDGAMGPEGSSSVMAAERAYKEALDEFCPAALRAAVKDE